MGFIRKKVNSQAQMVVMEAKVFLNIPAAFTEPDHQKVLSDLNTLLSNLTLEEMATLANYLKKPGAKEKALQLIKFSF